MNGANIGTRLTPSSTIAEACRVFDEAKTDVLPVCDTQNGELGTISDFEIRKFIVGGRSLDEHISPLVRPLDTKMPVPADLKGACAGGFEARPNLVVLMVGGAGTRLRPLTDNCPKPLLPVHGKPLLERTIEQLSFYGFRRFCFAVGHMADTIVNYFGNGSRWGVHIDYVREETRLGTCGALRLLPESPNETVLVMNGDLITGVRYDNLLDYHRLSQTNATVCVSGYEVPVPYGVIDCIGNKMGSLREKPVHKYWISAGIYLLEPGAIALIPHGMPYDMPTLLQSISNNLGDVSVYPIRERWIDIGSVDEYERANKVLAEDERSTKDCTEVASANAASPAIPLTFDASPDLPSLTLDDIGQEKNTPSKGALSPHCLNTDI
jgi:dTDP-glucose pyrophosphorylase